MSLEILQQKSDEYKENNSKLRDQLRDIESRTNDIDPKSPDARSQYDALNQERNAAVTDWNQKNTVLDREIAAAGEGLTGEERTQALGIVQGNIADRSLTKTQFNSTVSSMTQKRDKIDAGSNETNVDQTAKETEQKYEDSAGYNEETASLPDENQAGVDDDDTFRIEDKELVPNYGERIVPRVPKGAERFRTQNTKFVFRDVSGKKLGNDLRVKIRVPQNYWSKLTTGMDNELKELQGIIFPYTPSISTEFSADYSAVSPLHSNFPINFYQRSKISDISVAGKFTVENTSDAVIYLSTIHLLRALTRMRSGGKTGDSDSGSPPPVCRFDAYGEMMFKNVPVVIRSFKLELPESVDYFTIKGTDAYGPVSVPTVSTIAVTLTPMYSRNEMQKYSVTSYIQNIQFKKDGYL
jgi:hypothetical protein